MIDHVKKCRRCRAGLECWEAKAIIDAIHPVVIAEAVLAALTRFSSDYDSPAQRFYRAVKSAERQARRRMRLKLESHATR